MAELICVFSQMKSILLSIEPRPNGLIGITVSFDLTDSGETRRLIGYSLLYMQFDKTVD
jgi:hypothetical protein